MRFANQPLVHCLLLGVLLFALVPHPSLADTGDFEVGVDVGAVKLPGKSEFDSTQKQYRITGSGENMWKAIDAFHFLYRKVTGDLTLSTDVAFPTESKTPHRKAGCMVRASLDADSPYADAMVHGDGSIGLQFRKEKGGITEAMKATSKAPATLRLERHGDTFTLFVTPKEGPAETVGPVTIKLPPTAFAGLAVCSHDEKASETALFSKVSLKFDTATSTK